MKCCSFEEVESELKKQLKTQNLYPVLGAGFTCDCVAKNGNAPSGNKLRKEMLNQLDKIGLDTISIKDKDLKNIARYYKTLIERTKRTQYLLDNFTEIELPDYQKKFLNIGWKYIYTFNLDTAIEDNSRFQNVILPNKKVDENVIRNMNNCVFKVHGDVIDYCKYNDSNCYIFDKEEYMKSIKSNVFMLNKMNHDFSYNNLIFIGCSLTDELDLLSLSNVHDKPEKTSVYYITDTQPDSYKKIDLETYGITHVVIVDSYISFYEKMYQLFIESQKVQEDQLEKYRNIKMTFLSSKYSDNIDYLYLGKMLYNPKSETLQIPSFFIDREVIMEQLIPEMNKYNIQCICGGRISGKTYALVSILKNIRNRDVFLFDSRYQVNNETLKKLLEEQNSVLCFDTSCLSKDQIFDLKNNINTLKEKNINVVLCINRSDKDIISSIINMIDANDINIYDLHNRFSVKETKLLNTKLSIATIPDFTSTKTILDNLLIISQTIGHQYKRTGFNIEIKNKYDMIVLILLAIQEKLTSQEFVDFGIEKEIYDIYKKTTPILDEDYTDIIERDTLNSSTYKIYVNSKYWLLSKLGTYASNLDNHKLITEAYRDIVQKLINNHSAKYKAIEDYIKYDVINEIFFKPERGNLRLIKSIYDELNDLLSGNSQFFHQKAKCYLWHCDYSDDKMKELNDALHFGKVAKHNLETNSNPENLKVAIALSHIDFTIALIYAKKNTMLNYKDPSCFKEAIISIRQALYSPYNREYCNYLIRKNEKKVNDIKKFLDYAMTNDLSYLILNVVEKRQLDEITTFRMQLNQP